MTETFTPAQAASALDTDSSTIRRWCGWHSEHLSDGASPGPGGRRLITEHDMEVLRTVKALRIAGLTTPAINEQLAGRTFAVVDSTEAHQTATDGHRDELAPIVASYDLAAVTAPILARLAAVERAQRDRVVVFALGFLAACGLFALILLLFVLFGR